MTLRRTASGLRSLHRFHNVDLIVYCEGGASLDANDVVAGRGASETLDAQYWAGILSMLAIGRKTHVKAVGCKKTLIQIATDIGLARINTVSVCLDSDDDGHLAQKVQNPRIAYSFGYSWENDVVTDDSVEAVAGRLFGASATELVSKVRVRLAEFRRTALKWCEIEIALAKQGKEAIFDRSRPLALCSVNGKACRVDATRARARLQAVGYSKGPTRHTKLVEQETLRHMAGKVVSRVAYHLFTSVASEKSPKFRISYDVFMRLLISETIELMRSGRLTEQHSYFVAQRACFI